MFYNWLLTLLLKICKIIILKKLNSGLLFSSNFSIICLILFHVCLHIREFLHFLCILHLFFPDYYGHLMEASHSQMPELSLCFCLFFNFCILLSMFSLYFWTTHFFWQPFHCLWVKLCAYDWHCNGNLVRIRCDLVIYYSDIDRLHGLQSRPVGCCCWKTSVLNNFIHDLLEYLLKQSQFVYS